MLSETTDGVTTAYEYGVERISAYTKQTLSTQKTDYVYDGRGSVAQTLTYNSSWYTFGGFLSNKGVNSYTYTPYGELLTVEGSGYRFNGEYYDSATGMLNLRARQYEPSVMRFSQRDIWHGAQVLANTQNRYLYCIDDPINLYDYSGKVITGKNAGVRLPISKPLVDLTKDKPELRKSVADSISKLSALISTGIDTTGYNDAQRKVVEQAEKKLLEEALNGTLSIKERESIIKAACYESFWAGGEDYFSGNWWQDKTKRDEAYQMLLLEAQVAGSLDLLAIDQEKTSKEVNNKMLGFQAIANAERTGVWDEGTLSAIENGLVASGIAGSYNVTPDELAILSGREIIGRETGYWLESSGLVDSLNNASILMILYGSSVENGYSNGKAGQNAGDLSGGEESGTKLYRVMSQSEYDAFMNNEGRFTQPPVGPFMEEKWFATSAQDAAQWGSRFYPDGGYRMIEIEVPSDLLSQMYYSPHLDGIGPAYAGGIDWLNSIINGVKNVK